MARLYSDVVLERFKHPRYFGELDAPDAAHEDVMRLEGAVTDTAGAENIKRLL